MWSLLEKMDFALKDYVPGFIYAAICMKIFNLKLVPQKHQEKKEADWKKDFCSALIWSGK